MKQLLYIFLVAGILSACGKVETYSNDFSSAAFINATPIANPPAGVATTNMRIFVDTLQKTSSNVVYTGSSGYLSIQPGTRNIQIKNSLNYLNVFAESGSELFVANMASTFVIYDTINPATGKARLLRLTDTLTLPAINFIKVRFLQLAVNAPVMDVTFLRTSATPNDSLTFFNQSYVGSSPTASALSALSAFTTIPAGAYTVKLKKAGTQILLGTQPLSLANLTGTGNQTGINTIFSTGTAQGQPLRVGLFRHYP